MAAESHKMARTTLQRRLTLLFCGIIAGVVFLISVLLWLRGEELLVNQAKMTGLALARGLAATTLSDFLTYDYIRLGQKAEETVRDSQVAWVILYDKEGGVAAFSGQGGAGGADPPPPLSPSLRSLEGPVVEERRGEGFTGPGLDVLVPVSLPGTGQRWGAVRLGFRLDAINSQVRTIRWSIFILGLVGVLAGALASLHFTRRITVPLRDLVQAAGKVAGGDLDTRITVSTGDEMADLADGFNGMVERLSGQRAALMGNLAEIRSLKMFNDLVLLSITNGLFTVGADGRVLTFNRKAEEILRVRAEEAVDRSPGELLGADNPLAGAVREAEGSGGTLEREIRLPVHGGEERVLSLSIAPIRQDQGPPIGLLCLFHDLTEKKALEQRIARADRLAAMGTLAAGLAHEIRNPLAAVRAFVQIIPEKFESASFREKFSRTVPRELDRVNGLLENLLDLVRKPRLEIVHIEARKAVDQVLELLEPEVLRRGVEVVRRIEEGLALKADVSHLGRILHNLLLNAVQAMPVGGSLTVEAFPERDGGPSLPVPCAVIRITDTGVGVPAENLKDLFNPFFTNKEKGTGLGLAVTHKLLEDMGGGISFRSERGKGTTFTLLLPSAPAA